MSLFPLKATYTYVKAYYAALRNFHEHGHTTERYILRLIGQIITVSLETQQIIAALPSLNFRSASTSDASAAPLSSTKAN